MGEIDTRTPAAVYLEDDVLIEKQNRRADDSQRLTIELSNSYFRIQNKALHDYQILKSKTNFSDLYFSSVNFIIN